MYHKTLVEVNSRSRRVNDSEMNPRYERGRSGVLDSKMLVEVDPKSKQG